MGPKATGGQSDGCGCQKNRSNSPRWKSFETWCIENDYEYLLGLWDYDLNTSDRGVEPIQDVFKRCEDFLDYIKNKYSDDDSILIVTHGSPYRALRYLIRKEELKGHLLDGVIDNCQCEEFEYK